MGGCASENPGIADVINELTTMSKKCPNQKYVLTGLSQGGVVTVRSVNVTSPDLLSRIIAVALFQSPKCPTVVKNKCKSYCNNDVVSKKMRLAIVFGSLLTLTDLHRDWRRQGRGHLRNRDCPTP
jgi:hypothetical protein